MFAVTELVTQPGTDPQVVTGVSAEVTAVEHGVHVDRSSRPLSIRCSPPTLTGGYGPPARTGGYLRSADRASAVIGVEDDSLERSLPKTLRSQARVADTVRPVPGFGEVEFDLGAKEQVEEVGEIRSGWLPGEVVALALDDAAGKSGGGAAVESSARNGCLARGGIR